MTSRHLVDGGYVMGMPEPPPVADPAERPAWVNSLLVRRREHLPYNLLHYNSGTAQ